MKGRGRIKVKGRKWNGWMERERKEKKRNKQ